MPRQNLHVCMICEKGSDAHKRAFKEHPEWACWSYVDWTQFGLECDHLLEKCDFTEVYWCARCKYGYKEADEEQKTLP